MTSRRVRTAIVIGLMAAGLGVSPLAQASSTPPVSQLAASVNEEDQDYAKKHDVSLDKAHALRLERSEFEGIVARLYEHIGEKSVDVWTSTNETTSDQTFNVRVKDPSLLPKVEAETSSSTLRFSIEVRDWILSERTATALTKIDGVPIDGLYVDVITGNTVLHVSDRNRADVAKVASQKFGEGVQLVSTGEGAHNENRGGLNLSTCTSGFAATWNGYVGFFTAAHCGTQSWAPPGSSSYIASTLRTQINNGTADIQFRSVPNGYQIYADMWTGNTLLPITNGSGQAVVGNAYCGRGKTTGYRCGSVNSTNFTPTFANACNGVPCGPNFVATNGQSGAGDSGGPWYSGQQAFGIHKGTSGGAIWSKIGFRPSASNVFTG